MPMARKHSITHDHKALLADAVRCHQNGQLDQAARYYTAILDQWPEHPDALHLLGVIFFQQGDSDRAIERIEQAIRIDPSLPAFHSNLGNAYRDAGRIDSARNCYAEALKRDPHFADAYFGLGQVLAEAERFEEALAAFEKAADLRPDCAQVYFCMGNVRKALGREHLEDGAACYRKAIALDPDYPQARIELGNTFLEQSCWDQAIDCFEHLQALYPQLPQIHLGLGHACLGSADTARAITAYREALRLNPGEIDAWHNLGIALKAQGDFGAAIACFLKLIELEPHRFGAYVHLGNLYDERGMAEQALAIYARALVIDPKNYKILSNMGSVQLRSGRIGQAIASYRHALAIRPGYPDCLHKLGIAQLKAGNPAEALICFKQALKADPGMIRVHNSIANAYKSLGQAKDAIDHYQQAIARCPDFSEAWQNLGRLYAELGLTDKAAECYDEALIYKSTFGLEVERAMLLPLFYESTEEIDRLRADLERRLDRLMERRILLEDPYRQVRTTNFNLALHGLSDRDLRVKIAKFYLTSCPELDWVSPNLKKARKPGDKIKIGFLSRYLFRHTIGYLYAGIIKKLSKEKFHITVFRIHDKYDEISKEIDCAADKVVFLSGNLRTAREQVASHLLDILFYPEIGMDAFTYFMAFSRLAPVQCKRGFQITMGIPAIDYFISSDTAEPADAQKHYSEKVIRLKGTGYYYSRPPYPTYVPSRQEYGLPESNTLYACPQSLFKIHPKFDEVIAKILNADDKAVIVLVDGVHRSWNDRIINRFKKILPDASRRFVFLPRKGREEFLLIYLLADAVIDTLFLSGGNTSLECFAWGVPVVTLPSPLLPGRLTYGFYKLMGVMDCVAENNEDYVRLAVRLANDSQWKNEISKKIKNNSKKLFENIEDIRELESIIEQIVDQHIGIVE